MKTNYSLLFLLLLSPAQRTLAQSPENQCIVVETNDGECIEYLLSNNPRIVHNEATVVLTTISESIEFQTANVSKVYFSAIPTSIGKMNTSEGQFKFQQNAVILKDFGVCEPVALYDTEGRLFWQQVTDSDGHLMVSLSSLPQGTYIVRISNKSFKVTRK